MRQLFTIICLVLCPVFAFCQDDPASVRFQQAYDFLIQADKKRSQKEYTQAISFYSDSLASYKKLALDYPEWQSNVVRFRITYCSDQIEALLKELGRQYNSKAAQGTNSIASPGETGKQIDVITSTARTLLRNNQNVKARVLLLEGINIEPDNPEIRLLLGVAQCQAGQYSDAVYILEELVTENTTNAYAQNLLGTAYYALGLIPRARDAFAAALKIAPDMKDANYNMAQALLDTRDPKISEAKTYYDKAIKLGASRNSAMESKLGLTATSQK